MYTHTVSAKKERVERAKQPGESVSCETFHLAKNGHAEIAIPRNDAINLTGWTEGNFFDENAHARLIRLRIYRTEK